MQFEDEVIVVEVLHSGAIRSEGVIRGRFPLSEASTARELASTLADKTGIEHAIITIRGKSGTIYLDLGTAIQKLSKRVEDGSPPEELNDANRSVTRRFGRSWPTQVVENMLDIARCPSVGALHDMFNKQMGVIVSPGPSLDKNIRDLSALRHKAVIFATSQTLTALEKAGVTPTFSVSADSQELMREHFDCCSDFFLSRIAMVVCAVSHRVMFDIGKKAKALFTYAGNGVADEWPYAILPERPPLLSGGGSVSCVATTLAINMGCDPIVLVGQDLAYDRGKHYASTVKDLKIEVEKDGRYRYVVPEDHSSYACRWEQVYLDGYHGGEVPTSSVMRDFHRWFEYIAIELDGARRLVNATEGGAKIVGWEQMPLRSVPRLISKDVFDIHSDIVEKVERAATVADVDTRVASMREYAAFLMEKMRACEASAKDGNVEATVEHLQYLPMVSVTYQDVIADALTDLDPRRGLTNLMALAEDASVLLIPALTEVIGEPSPSRS